MLHAVQDLYSHSNYIEMNGGAFGGRKASQEPPGQWSGAAGIGAIPLWPMFGGEGQLYRFDRIGGAITILGHGYGANVAGAGTAVWDNMTSPLAEVLGKSDHYKMAKDREEMPRANMANAANAKNYDHMIDLGTRHSRRIVGALMTIPRMQMLVEACAK